jgi:hypothetical protein
VSNQSLAGHHNASDALSNGERALAHLVEFVAGAVALIIAVGIVLALLKANPGSGAVSEIHGWGRWLVGPFAGMFSFHSSRVQITVNWGIAAIIYLFAGGLIARLIVRFSH